MNPIEWLKGFFNKALKAFKALLAVAIPPAKQIIIGALRDIARTAVQRVNPMNLSNEAKREAAFKEIKEYAEIRGLEARDSLIYTLVELTVLALKEENPSF